MKISYTLNGRQYTDEVSPAQPLTEYLRSKGCLSVKRGCETSNCGLCTVLVNRKPVLSCSTLTARIDGKTVETLEGLQKEAEEIGGYLAGEGAEQCGFCSPGLIMNIIGMLREMKSPTEEEIRNYLAGNLCRCTGYVGQLRAIQKYLAEKEEA